MNQNEALGAQILAAKWFLGFVKVCLLICGLWRKLIIAYVVCSNFLKTMFSCLKDSVRREREGGGIFHLLIQRVSKSERDLFIYQFTSQMHSSNGCNGQDWTRLKHE